MRTMIRSRPGLLLVLMAVATLLVVTTESLPIGLLSQMAHGLRTSESRVGLLVSAYGAVVVVGAVPLSAVAARVPVRWSMPIVLGVFVVSIATTAVSPDLRVAQAARLLGGAAHAVFYSCSYVMAVSVVPERLRTRAIAILGAGNALGLALGVPAATALGVWVGWRIAFASAAGCLCLTAVALTVLYRPRLPDRATPAPAGSLLRAAVAPPLLRIAIVIVLVMSAHFLSYTYISPLLQRSGVPASALSLVLSCYGIAGIIGLAVAGRFAATRLRFLLVSTIAVTSLALLLLWGFGGSAAVVVAATAVWGVAFGAAPTLWQLAAVRAAPEAASIGPAVVNSAFNVGISVGAWGGGLVLQSSGPALLPILSVTVIALALALALVARPGWIPRTATRGGPNVRVSGGPMTEERTTPG